MNNIIGNTPYRNIQNKKYIDSTAEYIGKLADFLEKEQIPYSGRINEYKSTITVSGEENFKRASEILDRIKSENPRRFIGNTQYKYIKDKRIIPIDADIVDKIAARLDSEHIMYSGIVEGEKGRITVSGSEIEALVKGYIEQERNGYAKVSFEISLTSDAFDEIYYLSDKSGNAYYDADGVVPTFNHVDDAAEYAKAHNISISTDEAQINQWREIERADKIRHDNAKLVTSFPRMGNDYPDHFTYNSDGNSFEWIYYNPDGNFGEGEFVCKAIYEQDIIAAYNAKISAADETTGRNEFIYSLFNSCEEYIISSDTEAFTSAARNYINKPENTLEFYGIAENSSNIIDVDRLISALEEKSPAVRSSEEEKANIIHNSFEVIINAHDFSKEAIKFLRRTERFMVKDNIFMVDENIIKQKFHIMYGDVSRATKRLFGVKFKDVLDELNLVIKQNTQLSVKKPNVFEEYYDNNSPVGNIVHDDNLSLSERLYNIAKQELEEYESSLDTAEKAKAAAYELTVKRDILAYIEYDLSSDIADPDVQSAIESLIKTGSPLSVYYNEWLKNEYDNRMEAVRMTAADVHRTEVQHIQKNMTKVLENKLPDGMAVFKPDVSIAIENSSTSIHAAFEEINKNHEFSSVAVQFLNRAEKIMMVNNFSSIDDVFSSAAIQNTFGSRERIDVALFDGKLSEIEDELKRYIFADTPSKIAIITVHQYDSQYTKSIENLSLSDAIRQMNDVKYTAFSEMGEQISTPRAAEIEQGNDKWVYSLEFDLDYNTVRIYTSTDDYINIGIEEALSIVSNHSEEEIISELKKVAEKKEKQALERSVEEGIIGSMGYSIDEMDKAFEAENSRTDYGNKLADNGVFIGNSEKEIENSPVGNYDEELKKAAEYLKAYNEREFDISPDDEPFTADNLNHIGLGYTELGDNADYSFEVEADLEKYEVRYFLDEKLVKTDKYNSLKEMNEQELSNLEFDYFVSEGNEMLDKMIESGEMIIPDVKKTDVQKITNEKSSYMIVDDVRHAINELYNGTAAEAYDWESYHSAFMSVLNANVHNDISLPLYKSAAEKILLAAQADLGMITDNEYKNALSCLDMVLKNGQMLENPKEQEIEQFSFFSAKNHYVSMDEINPSKHRDAENDNSPKPENKESTALKSDYTINESNYGDFGGDKTRCQNNIAAIRLLKQVESEKRSATPEEQQILAKYIGWGGLANAFDSSKNDWSKEYAELKRLLTPKEYASARASTLNAHFTSYTVINSIYSALENMGFKGGKILEPALGTGNFFGSMPEEMRNNSKLSGVELDSITGRIAKLLYPSANIQIKGYENTTFENNSFDIAVSNVPFGSYKVNDKDYNNQNMYIHDYFFAKTLDKVRPGGIVAFVTSKGTLDKESPEVRKYLAERAELLGAIRLPNTAFKQNAGTEVTSDIIFLQKREKPVSVEQNTPEWVFKDILENGIAVNKYFADHPEMILGEMVEGNKLYGNQANATMCVPIEGADLKEQLAVAIQNIKGEYNEAVKLSERENASHLDTVPCPPDAPKYGYVISDDTLYYHEAGDTMERVNDEKNIDRIKAMTQLRDSVHELLDLQINNYNGENEVKISDAQNKLSKDYDDFVELFGRIGQAENKKAFSNDNSYHLIKSLEKTDNSGNFIGKADIFSKKTINPQIVIDHCNNAQDALILSLSEKMRVDMDYMSMLTDKSESELVAELGDKIYQNPQKNMRWESADEYLTGNIRAKLAAAEEAGLERNIEAIRAVMPQRIEAADISVKLGSAWIDPEYIRQFILETLKPDFQTRNSIEVIYSEATDKWKVEGYQHSYGNTLATETYGTSDMNAYEIIEVSLNMKKAEIRERVKDENGIEIKDEKGRYVLAVNQDKTMVVQSKQDELKNKFKDWIFATPERREKLTNLYNEKFNSVRLREYDGSHLNFVGMNSNIALKPHQKNAVARSLYSNGNTLIAHEVGAGKTFEMVAIAMEGKRLGLHSKPLITAPNALTEQWGDAFRTLYPNSNVLVATEKDFKPENRRDLFAKIATGDWDAVIIGHSQFDMIHLSRERELETLYSEVDKLEAALDEISATSNKGSYSVKQVERAIKSYTDKIQKLLEKTPKEDMLCFEQLGIDKIFVDESQAYKNLDTPTKMQNVSGIGSGGSGRSMQLLMKCRYLDEVTGGKGVIFASGTPISNSMSEMYTLMRYLQADKLRELGINSFDRWASIFGETTTSMELSPEANGKYQMKTRFAKFQNLPELMNIFKECADIKTAATLNLDRPDFEMHNINVPATKMQSKMIKDLGERAKLIRAGAVDPTEDNMCKLTVDGRKIGLDQRCMNPSLPDDPNSKVNVCINNVFDIWKQTAEKKSTQLIFCDLATPQAAVNENTYTLYRKDTKGEYAPVYSAKLGQKDTADKIFKKLTGSKPPKNFKAGGVFDGDIIMLHTVDYDTMTASNSAVIASNGKISEVSEEIWSKLHHSPTEAFESERKFCVYDDIKQKLMAKGVPEKEIAFIHDADTTEEKQKLFAKMNKGEIRVMIGSTAKCGAGMNAQERMIALHDLDAPMRPSDMEQRHGRIIRQGNTNTKVDIYRYTTDKTFDAYLYQMLENKQKFISQIMTDKSPVRSCEDVDEIALDYAEVKALCAGNPLIKEKIDLETEITKLNVLKSSFLSQKYAVQDKAYTILPREKSVKETYIDKLKKDVEFAEKEQPLQNEDGKNYYPVTVGDKKYHEKDAAGEAIRQAVLDNKDILQGKEVHIGSYRGFEMTAFLDVFSKKIKVNLQGATNHYGELNMDINVKAGGNIIRLDNVINSIGITLMKEEEGLQAICADIEQAKAAADAVFPQEQELAAKEKRLVEVNAQLASTKVNTQDRSSELYAALVDICPALQYSKEFHCKYEAGEGIEPLCIERNGDVVFVAHTYTQNGDLMYDPAIEFYFDSKNQKAEALSYELSGMGMYQDFRDGNLPNEKADVEEMVLETMFVNIKDYDYKLVETNIDTEIDEDERGEDKKEINR
jgi:N12 class adenine-specific DNA methylase